MITMTIQRDEDDTPTLLGTFVTSHWRQYEGREHWEGKDEHGNRPNLGSTFVREHIRMRKGYASLIKL